MMLDRVIDDLFGTPWLGNLPASGNGSYTMRVPLPGVKAEEIDAKLVDGMLTIHVNRKVEAEPIEIRGSERDAIEA